MNAQVTSTSRASRLRFELLPDVLEWIISQVAWEGAKAVLNRAKLLRKRQPPEEPRRVRVLRANDTVTISATVISQHQDTPPTPR